MSSFKSFIIKEKGSVINGDVVVGDTNSLPAGELLIEVLYSTINSYDILFAKEDFLFCNKKFPYVPGVNAVGIVKESSSDKYRKGDEVLIFGNGLGLDIPGGFGGFIRVPSDWIINLPTGLSLKDSVTLGSDGITSAIAVAEILAHENKENKDIIISGASYGIGAFATAILSNCGYNVTAITNDMSNKDFIKEIGASKVISTNDFIDKSSKYMLEDKYIAGIDCFGGDVLNTMIKSVKSHGTIALCSAINYDTFTSSMLPFILRGVNLIGINGLNCSQKLKQNMLYKLAGDWYIKSLSFMCDEISIFDIDKYMKEMSSNSLKGKVVINHKL